MNRSLLESVLRRVGPMADQTAADAELLRRFAAGRDEAAFAALVRRHGPFVWAVCRGLLPLEADAEDAFQATFLSLVRSAKSVRAPARLGSWLHGVACRVALKARRSAARRKQRERSAAASEVAAPVGAATWDRLRAALHEEVCQLPEPLRTAFVLCELEGVAQGEAARTLGWKLGTLSGRLTKARQLLLDRLGKNGVPAGVAVAAAVTGGSAIASAPVRAVARAVALARSDLTGVISANVLELARGATEVSMTRSKYLAAALALAAAVAIGTGTTLIPVATAQRAPVQGQTPGDTTELPQQQQPGAQNKQRFGGGGGGTIQSYGPFGGGAVSAAAQWEYKFLSRPGDAQTFKRVLTEQGAAGWEYSGVEQFAGAVESAIIVFKRPKAAAATRDYKTDTATQQGVNDGKRPPTNLPLTGKADTARDQGRRPPLEAVPIQLRHANARDLAATLDQLFGDRGCRVVADLQTNTLFVQGDDAVIKAITAVVQQVDKPTERNRGASK